MIDAICRHVLYVTILEFAVWQALFLALGILIGGGVVYRCFVWQNRTEE